MKWLIASDIHGSALFCEQLLEAYRREGAERLLLLGDILYHGPRNDLPEGYAPKKVIPALNALKDEITAVRGNCDADIDIEVLDFPMAEGYIEIRDGGVVIFAAHGHTYGPGRLPPMPEGGILLCGHFHVPAAEGKEGFTYLNPGSVSIPKDGSERGYAILQDGVFTLKTLDGKDIKSINLT